MELTRSLKEAWVSRGPGPACAFMQNRENGKYLRYTNTQWCVRVCRHAHVCMYTQACVVNRFMYVTDTVEVRGHFWELVLSFHECGRADLGLSDLACKHLLSSRF